MVFLGDLYLEHYSSFFMNDLLKTIKMNSKPFLFADDSNLIITNTSPAEFKKWHYFVINKLQFVPKNESFNGNSLFSNYEKTHYLHFMTKRSSFIHIIIGYNNKHIKSTSNTKFLGIVIEKS